MATVDILFDGNVGNRVAGTVSPVPGTVITTAAGVCAFTHLWWSGAIGNDPRATQPELLQSNRDRVLEVATVIVPGHGAAFAATAAPRVDAEDD